MKIKKLTPELAAQLQNLRALKKKFDKDEKELCEAVKKFMQVSHIDTYNPPESPVQLKLTEVEKRVYAWKEECARMYELHYGETWERRLERYMDGCPISTEYHLGLETNPNSKAILEALADEVAAS